VQKGIHQCQASKPQPPNHEILASKKIFFGLMFFATRYTKRSWSKTKEDSDTGN
jgi:hypothetical protein